ncbi:MAG TPA: universal stress protein [Xanthobacteraceae bacterium]|nr:universal stress protein [Xanthobacteraceae bacterium]
MKNILVNLAAGNDAASTYAISLAEAFDAYLLGVIFTWVPAIRRSVTHTVAAGLMEAHRLESEKAAQAALARFDAATRRAGVSAGARMSATTLPGASDLFGRLARRFDLSIVGQAEPNTVALEDLIVEAALFDSGRPVIVVPSIQHGGLKLDRVLMCWDGSRAAARVFADAMPLIKRAATIEVVMVTSEPPKSDELPGADIAENLARHGLAVNVKRIGRGGIDVAATILNYASDAAADLIVMGAYGHSRLREFVLGGTTRAMLASMTVPTLMSH